MILFATSDWLQIAPRLVQGQEDALRELPHGVTVGEAEEASSRAPVSVPPAPPPVPSPSVAAPPAATPIVAPVPRPRPVTLPSLQVPARAESRPASSRSGEASPAEAREIRPLPRSAVSSRSGPSPVTGPSGSQVPTPGPGRQILDSVSLPAAPPVASRLVAKPVVKRSKVAPSADGPSGAKKIPQKPACRLCAYHKKGCVRTEGATGCDLCVSKGIKCLRTSLSFLFSFLAYYSF